MRGMLFPGVLVSAGIELIFFLVTVNSAVVWI